VRIVGGRASLVHGKREALKQPLCSKSRVLVSLNHMGISPPCDRDIYTPFSELSNFWEISRVTVIINIFDVALNSSRQSRSSRLISVFSPRHYFCYL